MNFNSIGDSGIDLSSLSIPLYNCLDEAITKTLETDADLCRLSSTMALVIRGRFCLLLEEADLHGWTMKSTPSRHGHFELYNENGIRLRGLKESPVLGLPPAGRNHSRQNFYQPSLFDDGNPDTNLILSWGWNSDYEITTLRVSHPIECGKFGSSVKTDFCMNLMPNSGDMSIGQFNTEDTDTVLSFKYEENYDERRNAQS